MYFLPGLFFCAALCGCASTGDPRDPLESVNRAVFNFNDAVDKAVVKPVAIGYTLVVPDVAITGVTNFFANLGDFTIAANNLLQLKIRQAASDVGRLVINSTVGLLGVLDIASKLGLEKHNEDLGQTLGYWGVGNGPYLVLPLFGPTTARDGMGTAIQLFFDPITNSIDDPYSRNLVFLLKIVNTRATLLELDKVLEAAALDRYEFLREAYLQRRRSLVYDGNPPREKYEEDEDDGETTNPVR
ncbi:MAG TPA: VacJ family lipoprotein [Burkholderiales bacterium]|nr:VacJ family lipoprotein [Burkholderiales bacterium]